MSSLSSRAKLLGATAIAFACGLVFASGFDLAPFSWAQGRTPARQAGMAPAAAPASVVELNTSFVGIAERVSPAVVSIAAERAEQPTAQGRPNIQRRNAPPGIEDFFQQFGPQEQQRPQFSSGTGFIVSKDGYVLTNNHVVENMDKITVTLIDRRQLPARVVGRDPQTDVAVLKVSGTDLPVSTFGNDDGVKVGEWVLAIGNPLGLDHTVTAGIVSAKGRGGNDLQGLNTDRYAIQDFIQTDAAINPGNSGGPLVNIRGEVIGINSAIATRTGYYQGYGFAIPINLARDVMDDLIKNGRVRRAVVGVSIRDASPADAKAAGLKDISGALVHEYSGDPSPAKTAGIEIGDVIVKADGKPVDRTSTLQRIIRSHAPGETVELEVMRYGDRKTYRVKLVEAPSEAQQVASSDRTRDTERESEPVRSGSFEAKALGATLENLTEEFIRESRLPADRRGVRVVEAERWAQRGGYFAGDGTEIITAVMFPRPRKEIRSTSDLREVLGRVKDGDTISLQVYNVRAQQSRVVSLTVGEQ
jgi:serine protease Do